MKANDRARLTTALRDHVAKIAADLRAKMRAPGDARVAAEQLHKDERVAEDFEVWTDLLSRRAAVLWVLKSVYVRVLEDRGLLSPGRLLDPEAQQLFEKLAPNLGETAFLRWVYKDLASTRGGVPELFSPQPAEVALPSDELSRGLIAFWRHRDVDGDADAGAVWSFAEEKFEGELMGDLYQELDPVVKDRFALCQTPEFVRAFILDRTLTPAVETFGADEVRLLDPACGSGHFLIDGLKRLVAATGAKHADWDRAKVVAHALDRVVGVDLNDYACALARTRLIMTAAELAGVTKLADAARFHPHVYWADGLEQVEKEEQKPSIQFSLFEKVEDRPRATLTRSDVRAALKKVFEKKFHSVMANPPYITEKDAARKEYHREKVGKKQRYVSAYREYSLGSPFTERCFQLAESGGFVGIITSNNFMKREFGKPLIETVLAGLDLALIVDTSQAYIPFHGTPTVLLFGRNRRPDSETVRAVMGKRGESGVPQDPAKGKVWTSILEGWNVVGFESEYVSVADLARETLGKHPWSLGGGGAAELKSRLDKRGDSTVGSLADVGIVCMTRADDAYVDRRASTFLRLGVEPQNLRWFPLGNSIRDWGVLDAETAVFPYDETLKPVPASVAPGLHRFLWPFRTQLWERREPNGSHRAIGLTWFEWSRLIRRRIDIPLSIAYPLIATHNHFVLDQGTHLFSQGSPVIKLPAGSTEDDHFALLGVLNSSTACFWMKQVFHNKHGSGDGKGMRESWMDRFEFDSTKMQLLPVIEARSKTLPYARQLDALARHRTSRSIASVLIEATNASSLRAALDVRHIADLADMKRMIALQEELDWLCYSLYGLSDVPVLPPSEIDGIVAGERPFEIEFDAANQREADCNDSLRTDWFSLQGWASPSPSWPKHLGKHAARYERRLYELRNNAAVRLIETPDFKRRWYKPDYAEQERVALTEWLADRVEQAAKARTQAFSLEQLVASLQDDARVLAVCEVLTGKKDFSLSQLVMNAVQGGAVPSHRFHVYKPAGLVKREVWERTWADQRREDAGEKVTPEVPPAYGSGDFFKPDYWRLRGKLDVPKERFIAFTESPGRSGVETLYGWAGWTAQQRVKAILAIDEELEDASVPLADRIGLLDSAWRLLPDVAREDGAAATRLKAELQALVGPDGPSAALIDDWKKRFPPASARAGGARKSSTTEVEEDKSLDDLPSVIPNVSDEEHAAILIWALLHAFGGTATRMDLARAFALRARPALLKKLAPASLKREVAHWVSTVGSRSVKAGLLASTLGALAARSGVALGTKAEGRATVSASSQTPSEAQIDSWFHFEANLALKVLRAQPEEKLGAIDKALTGADRKLLEAAA